MAVIFILSHEHNIKPKSPVAN